MKIFVDVKTRGKKEFVKKNSEDHYTVKVHCMPIKGAANRRVIELLADYFQVPKSSISLIRGIKNKKKQFIIHEK